CDNRARPKGRSMSRTLAVVAAGLLVALALFGGITSSAQGRKLVGFTVDTLPISNGLPLDLGIKHGFFQAQGIDMTKRTLQSGNDIVLALSNRHGETGYVGWVPAMTASTGGITL